MTRAVVLTLCLAAATGACGQSAAPAQTPTSAAAPAPVVPAAVVATAPVADTSREITPEGMGPVRIGMTQDEAVRALGSGWRVGEPLDESPGACRHIFSGPEDAVGPVAYMLIEGRIARVEVSNTSGQTDPSVRSDRGIRLGATEDEVRRAYGAALQSEGHRYLGPTARYLTLWTANGPRTGEEFTENPAARGIRFVTGDDRRVQEIIAGNSAIQFIEGCA